MSVDGAAFRRAAERLKQVADPTRLHALVLLGEEPRHVNALVRDLGLQSQPAVSHHLALLRAGRLVEPRREGKNNIYSLTNQGRAMVEAVRGLIEHESQG